MRLITDGELYAVARRRWIFTQLLCAEGLWWGKEDGIFCDCWTTRENAEIRMKFASRKFWDVK